MGSRFLFATCQLGAEYALKEEIARNHPTLRFAYSRPGFVTFKVLDQAPNAEPGLDADFELRSVFARAYGLSLGKTDARDLTGRARETLAFATSATQGQSSGARGKLRLHVWERDFHPVGEHPPGFIPGKMARQARETLLRGATDTGLFHEESGPPASGELVLDVIVLEESHWWVGYHRHGVAHSPAPGGLAQIDLPAEAPSRAYLKLEQGLGWSGAPIQTGQLAVEIGSAPGGASFALVRRGVRVIGIDPGEMDPVVLNSPLFTHLHKGVADVKKEEIPAETNWVLLDMNVGPHTALSALERIVEFTGPELQGVLLTLKLNEWRYAREIPLWLERVRKLGPGMVRVRATQLPANKQEIFVSGLTRRARLSSPHAPKPAEDRRENPR